MSTWKSFWLGFGSVLNIFGSSSKDVRVKTQSEAFIENEINIKLDMLEVLKDKRDSLSNFQHSDIDKLDKLIDDLELSINSLYEKLES